MIRNAMTVDVEDYFQVSAMEPYIARSDWPKWPCFVEQNTDKLLQLFSDKSVQGTFFILGWVAQHYPQLVRRIAEQGHEIACHGMDHTRVYHQTKEDFATDIRTSKALLEEVAGVNVRGYRAASYSITRENLWALDALESAGFAYSSSIYPVKHDLYGIPDAPRSAFRPARAKQLIEVPVTTAQLAGRNLPAGGGGFFRLFPYRFSRFLINRVNRQDNMPAVFYLHPWEIHPEQPRPDGINLKTRVRHYLNLEKTYSRLERLLSDFSWGRMDDIFLTRPTPVVNID